MKTKLLLVLVYSFVLVSAFARPRPALPPLPEFALNQWRFDQTNWWTAPRTAPSEMAKVALVDSWSGSAARLSPKGGVLRFPAVNSAGKINLALEEGSVRFWFAPDWSSASRGGTGPGSWARLLDVGAWAADAGHGWWSLYFDPSGSNLLFSVQADGVGEDYLAAPIAWRSNEWHQITLTYGPKFTALYLDGELAAAGPAIGLLPSSKSFVNTGFTVGSDTAGRSLAQGTFDELATFGFPLEGDYIRNNYLWAEPQAALGPITAAEEEARREWITKLKAARELEAESGGGAMMMMMLSGGCPNLKLTASLLTNSQVQIDICGKESNARYDFITTTNLNPTASWQWLAEIPYPTNTLVVSTNTEHRFFQLKKVPDLDGDGQRDHWEWGGSVPGGIVIDDDRDNDGIPDSIETTAGSATNDPASLPPPSLYVSTTGPATGADGSLDLPFRDLQTAINAATNYSVVLVKSGTYSGSSNRSLTFGGKRLVLISERGPSETFLSETILLTNTQVFAFTSTNEDYRSQVIGFTITASQLVLEPPAPPAITCTGGSGPTFVNCEFRSCATGAVGVTNSSPVFVNCRFRNNSTAFWGGNGSAVYATGSDSIVRLSHCLVADNNRQTNAGQIYAANGASITLRNSIVWSFGTQTNLGPDLISGSGAVTAMYSDVRGGWPGEGNLNLDPMFDSIGSSTGSFHLTFSSPCIDQGVIESFPGFSLFTRLDFDGEQRLDHSAFANAYGAVDIGPDEFVYRLAFPLVSQFPNGNRTNSEVDEASGLAFLGTNTVGPVIAIVDDEDRKVFHTYQLNSNATAIVGSFTNDVVEGVDDEVSDLEGLTFDKSIGRLYLITSQTKRNRYRDVDSTHPISDPVVDPPSSDYDRRRTKLIQVTATANLTNMTGTKVFHTSESNSVPGSVGYDATNGLAAFVWKSFLTNSALGDRSITNRVLIARNTANKFGTPVNGAAYPNGASLPYKDGGPATTAGVSIGEFSGTGGVLTNNGLTTNTWYYYKVWARDANTNYTAGIVASNKTDGVPKLFVNEFMAAPTVGSDWIELYNPAFVAVNLAGLQIRDHTYPGFYQIPAGLTIPGRGFARFFATDTSGGPFLPFRLHEDSDRIVLQGPAPGNVPIDEYVYGKQDPDITEGRAWDGGPHGHKGSVLASEGAKFRPGSAFPPSESASNHIGGLKYFSATADVRGTNSYLQWENVGQLPPVWRYSPKQHDFHSINVEDFAFRSTNEMVIGLRSPLSNRTNGNAYYFVVTNVPAFTAGGTGWIGAPPGIRGPFEMNLGGLGIRSIKWCPDGLTNAQGQAVQRYLILAGNANGGPLVRERLRQKSALYSWTGHVNTAPVKLLDDLHGYAVRPEGVDIMSVGGGWRLLFVEDRFLATGYGTRNAIHWPVTLTGSVP